MHTHLTHLPTHKTMEAQMHAARVVRKALRTMGSEVMPATFEAIRANVLTTLAEHHAALGPMYKPIQEEVNKGISITRVRVGQFKHLQK